MSNSNAIEFFQTFLTEQSQVPRNTVAKLVAEFKSEKVQNQLTQLMSNETVKQSRKSQRVVKDKNAPKRPKSAYIIFSTETRESVQSENPALPATDVMKVLGQKWKELNDEQKAHYQELADADKVRYQTEMSTYVPPEPSVVEAEAKQPKQRAPHVKSGWQLYLEDYRATAESTKNVMTTASVQWKALSEEEKAVYTARASALKTTTTTATTEVVAPTTEVVAPTTEKTRKPRTKKVVVDDEPAPAPAPAPAPVVEAPKTKTRKPRAVKDE